MPSVKSKKPTVFALLTGCLGIALAIGAGWSLWPDTDLPLISTKLRAQVEPAVYPLRARFDAPGESSQGRIGFGSCIALEPRGIFLTAAHIVTPTETCRQIAIVIDGREFPAEILELDLEHDIAVLKIPEYGGEALRFSADGLDEGQVGFVFGYPTESSGVAVPRIMSTAARTTELNHTYRSSTTGAEFPVVVLQGASSHGASGGAITNDRGELVGMVVATRFPNANSNNATHVLAAPLDSLKKAIASALVGPSSDADGDGLTGANDVTPLVADFPALHIAVTSFNAGIRRSIREKVVELDAREAEIQDLHGRRETSATEYLDRIRRKSDAVSGGGIIGGGAYAVPFSYQGYQTASTRESSVTCRSEYLLSKEQVERLSESCREVREHVVEIDPEAGYLELTVEFRNYGPTAFILKDFELNVSANGELWETLAVSDSRDGFAQKTFGEPGGDGEQIKLTFDKIDTSRMLKLLAHEEKLQLRFEVVTSSLQFERRQFQLSLPKVRAKCARVELSLNGKIRRFYVSTLANGNLAQGVTLEQLLERIPRGSRDIEWGVGPLGDYLESFNGVAGTAVLYPALKVQSGIWVIFHNGTPLAGTFRETRIRPGDHVLLQYLTTEEFWGRPEEWANYAEYRDRLRDLAANERLFWHQLETFNKSGDDNKAWATRSKKNTRDEARRLLELYQDFFSDPSLPAPIRRSYPQAQEDIQTFAHWFTGERFNFPRWHLVFHKAHLWWNVFDDRPLQIGMTLRIGDETLETDPEWFDLSPDGNSGEISLPPKQGTWRVQWSPFTECELHVRDVFGQNESLRHIRVDDWTGLDVLLREQPLDQIKEGDPNSSKIELSFRLEHGGESIRQDRFIEHFQRLQPRVIDVVPTRELKPILVASAFWNEHDPAVYRHVAALFEGLYAAKKGQDEQWGALARAILANARSLDFRRCAELANELSDDDDVVESSRNFPPRITAPDLRRLGRFAAAVDSHPRDSAAVFAATRYVFRWLSHLRLRYCALHTEGHPRLPEAQLKAWQASLRKQIESDRTMLSEVDDDLIRTYLQEQYQAIQQDIAELKLVTAKK